MNRDKEIVRKLQEIMDKAPDHIISIWTDGEIYTNILTRDIKQTKDLQYMLEDISKVFGPDAKVSGDFTENEDFQAHEHTGYQVGSKGFWIEDDYNDNGFYNADPDIFSKIKSLLDSTSDKVLSVYTDGRDQIELHVTNQDIREEEYETLAHKVSELFPSMMNYYQVLYGVEAKDTTHIRQGYFVHK